MRKPAECTWLTWDKVQLFALGESLSYKEREELQLPLSAGLVLASLGASPRGIAGMWNGEFRPPKKGERYISGGPPLVWLAPNDLSDSFHIAKLVKVKTEVTTTISIDK